MAAMYQFLVDVEFGLHLLISFISLFKAILSVGVLNFIWVKARRNNCSSGIVSTDGKRTGITGISFSTNCEISDLNSTFCHFPSPWGPIKIAAE